MVFSVFDGCKYLQGVLVEKSLLKTLGNISLLLAFLVILLLNWIFVVMVFFVKILFILMGKRFAFG